MHNTLISSRNALGLYGKDAIAQPWSKRTGTCWLACATSNLILLERKWWIDLKNTNGVVTELMPGAMTAG
jgi:hypothetical protein